MGLHIISKIVDTIKTKSNMNTGETNHPVDGKEAAFASYPPPAYNKRNPAGGGAPSDHHHVPGALQKPPPPHHQQRGGGGYGYPPHYATRPSHGIQAVVSTSFGMDEEREDGPSRHHRGHSGPVQGGYHHLHREQYHASRYEGGRGQYDMHPRRDDHHSAFDPPHSNRDAGPPPQYGRELPPLPPRGGEPPHDDRRMPDDRRMAPSQHEDRRLPPHDDRRLLPSEDRRMPPNREDREDRRTTTTAADEARAPPASQIPPSPRSDTAEIMQIRRANSTASSAGAINPSSSFSLGQGPLKRSYWHHASSGSDEYQGSSIPRDFMPPKRSKVGGPSPSRREYIVTARPRPEEGYAPTDRESGPPSNRPPSGWFNRALSWEAREEYYRRDSASDRYSDPWSRTSPSYRESPGGPRWNDSPRGSRGYSPAESSYEGSWGGPRGWGYQDRGWGGPQKRDEVDYPGEREGFMRRQGTFESRSSTDSMGHPPMRYVHSANTAHGMDAPALPAASAAPRENAMVSTETPNKSSSGPVRLLALPDDRISLSETLCLVREVRHIELCYQLVCIFCFFCNN